MALVQKVLLPNFDNLGTTNFHDYKNNFILITTYFDKSPEKSISESVKYKTNYEHNLQLQK